jgi:hypothetical protein
MAHSGDRRPKEGDVKVSDTIDVIERHGVLLVFPVANQPDPPSLWSRLYPRSRMRWDWDAGGDARVVELWHMRTALATSRKVVYGKWLRGRATVFSRAAFQAILAELSVAGDLKAGLPREATAILELLEENSPQSTKALRALVGLQGKALASTFERAMKALWSRLLIVGAGEVDDGAFPSLAVGATSLLFEDIWAAREATTETGLRQLRAAAKGSAAIARELKRSRASVEAAAMPTQDDDGWGLASGPAKGPSALSRLDVFAFRLARRSACAMQCVIQLVRALVVTRVILSSTVPGDST